MKKIDFLIIGSGLGGLLCAYILSKEGNQVCLIEKNKQIGGCLQTFQRHGCVFDTGIHYIGSLDEGQVTNRLFKYFGLMDKLKLKRMDPNGFDLLDINGDTFKYPIGYPKLLENLNQKFPQEKNAIANYIKEINKVVDSLDLFNLKIQDNKSILNPYVTTNFYQYVSSLTDNKSLQNILAGLNFLYAGTPDSVSLYLHATIFHSFISSAWRTVDGADQIAHILAEEIKRHGGTILNESEVCRLPIKNGQIDHAELTNGDRLTAVNYISNAHPATTLNWIEASKMRKAYRERIHNLENTISSFTIYACLHEETLPYENYNYYRVNAESVWRIQDYSTKTWPEGFMFFTPASSNSPEFATCAIIMTFMEFKDVEQWQHTRVKQRGEDYQAFKRNKAELLLDEVEKIRPGFRHKIKKYYTSTPLTYRDYTGTKEGSIYGITRDCNNPIKTYIPARTKIPNLFFTGQNIGMHGVLGVSIGSLQTCAEFLGLNYLIKQVQDCS